MSENLEGFFEALSSEGTTQAKGLSFTVESEKARKKLQEFALAHPEHFQLLAIAGLYALGSRHFHLTVDADDFRLEAESELPRLPFTNLWSYASGGGEAVGYRLLALSLLTSTRLDNIAWSVSSRDEDGSWDYSLSIKSGEPGVSAISKSADGVTGIRLQARRNSLGHVALRYLGRLKDRMTGQRNSEERLVRERMFLPKDTSLTINKVEILPDLSQDARRALAVLESGQAPTLFDSQTLFKSSSDLTASVVLLEPERAADPGLPGSPDSMLWIWNGLKMDSTALGAEFAGFRAFVWAAELQPDLSLSQLVSDRAKQTLENKVKSLTRELLEKYVPTLTQEIRQSNADLGAEPFLGRLEIVKSALRARISLSKARTRLGRLNRILIECPILLGSDETGVRRWISFEEIWKELEASRPVAVWNVGEISPLPAYPGRPLVLETKQKDIKLLRRLIPKWGIIEASKVEQNLSEMLRKQDLPTIEGSLGGRFDLGGEAIEWSFSAAVSSSRLLLAGADGVRVLSRQNDWPVGVTVRVSEDQRVDYSGKFMDSALESSLLGGLLRELAKAIGQLDSQRLLEEEAVRSLLKFLKTSGSHSGLLEYDWLPVWSAEKGLHVISPAAYLKHLEEMRAPCFYLSSPPQTPETLTGHAAKLKIALIFDSESDTLEKVLGQKTVQASWLNSLQQLLADPPGLIWSAKLSAPLAFPQLRSLWMGVIARGGLPEGESLRRDLVSGLLVGEQQSAWLYPSLEVRAEWVDGWPDSQGTEWGLGGVDAERTLGRACLCLGERFLTEAQPAMLLKVDPLLLSSWIFDLLAEPQRGSAKGSHREEKNLLSESVVRSILTFLRTKERLPILLELDWLTVWSAESGTHTISPTAFLQHLVEMKAPCFYLPAPPESIEPFPEPVAKLRIALLNDSDAEALGKVIGRKHIRASWLCSLKAFSVDPPGLLWSAKLSVTLPFPQLRSLWMGVLATGTLPKGESLRQDVMAEQVVCERRFDWKYPSLMIRAEWFDGWPGCEGTDWEYGGRDTVLTLDRACQRLAARFLLKAGPAAVLDMDPALLATWMYELVSKPGGRNQPYFLSKGGRKVSFDSLPSVVDYVCLPADLESAQLGVVYLPGPLAKDLAEIDGSRTWQEVSSAEEALRRNLLGKCVDETTPETSEIQYSSEESRTSLNEPIQRQKFQRPVKPPVPPKIENASEIDPAKKVDRRLEVEAGPKTEHPEPVKIPPLEQSSVLVDPASLRRSELQELFDDLQYFIEEPIRSQYRRFLQALKIKPEEHGFLQVASNDVVLRRDAIALLPEASQRVYLHSALFSTFNRLRHEVTDLDERNFHLALLGWAIRSGKGPPDPRTKRPT